MLEDATNLINATYCFGLLGKLKTPVNTIVLLTIAGVLTGVVIMLIRRGNAIRHVKFALIDFATSWEALQGKERLDWQRDIIPVVKKGERIKEAVTKVPTTLTRIDFSCASDIAVRLNLKISSFERNVHQSSYGSSIPQLDLSDMDELAKRARKCAAELRWWRSKK